MKALLPFIFLGFSIKSHTTYASRIKQESAIFLLTGQFIYTRYFQGKISSDAIFLPKSIGIIFYIPPISKVLFIYFPLAFWDLLYQRARQKMTVTTEVRVTMEKICISRKHYLICWSTWTKPRWKALKRHIKKITVRALSKQFPYWICSNWLKPFFPFPH